MFVIKKMTVHYTLSSTNKDKDSGVQCLIPLAYTNACKCLRLILISGKYEQISTVPWCSY